MALGLLASGCGSPFTPIPAPTPQVITLRFTTTLSSLQPLFTGCANAQENTALIVVESPASSIDWEQEGLAIRWGTDFTVQGFAAVLGYEELVIIVHPQNPLQQISQADLQGMYSGALNGWPTGGPGGAVEPWSYPVGEDIQEITGQVLQKDPLTVAKTAFIAPHPRAMLEAVSGNPQAIGFLPRRWLNNQVKEIPLSGIDQAGLRYPILAITREEPVGLARDWLLCVQAGLAE